MVLWCSRLVARAGVAAGRPASAAAVEPVDFMEAAPAAPLSLPLVVGCVAVGVEGVLEGEEEGEGGEHCTAAAGMHALGSAAGVQGGATGAGARAALDRPLLLLLLLLLVVVVVIVAAAADSMELVVVVAGALLGAPEALPVSTTASACAVVGAA